jgi:uncharacterized protein YecE (DUF72 family)
MDRANAVFTGTSGLVLPVPNKSLYPAEYQNTSRLRYYSSLFNSIEINSSFYKLPVGKTVEKWSDETLSDFKFTYKLWREITHHKSLSFEPQNVDLFFQRIHYAGGKKGCVLIQLPPSTTIDCRYQLIALLNKAQEASRGEWRIVVEFRHSSWYQDEIYQVMQQAGAGLVIHDIPRSATPFVDDVSEIMYVRFHGPGGGYRGSYSESFLSEYAGYLRDWKEDGKEVFAYFNNTMGDAIGNLQHLKKLLS